MTVVFVLDYSIPNILRTSAVSSTNFGSILIWTSCVVGTLYLVPTFQNGTFADKHELCLQQCNAVALSVCLSIALPQSIHTCCRDTMMLRRALSLSCRLVSLSVFVLQFQLFTFYYSFFFSLIFCFLLSFSFFSANSLCLVFCGLHILLWPPCSHQRG